MSDKSVIPPSPSQHDYEQSEANPPEDIFAREDPFALFEHWLEDAKAKEPNDPNAVALATADEAGCPDVRMVLLKGFDARGFVFYTNTDSAKGLQLEANPNGRACAARAGFAARSARSARKRRTPISSPAHATAGSAPGRPSSPMNWKAGSRWRSASLSTRRSSISAKFPARRTGPDTGSIRNGSNSGAIAPSACTTGWCSNGHNRVKHGR